MGLCIVEFDTDQIFSETWSQARTCLVVSCPVRVVEIRNDTTRPDQRQSLVRPVPNSITRTRPDRTRPDQTKSADVSETRADPTDFVPSSMKSAYITPILKKADLDSSDPKSYRPISNLSVLAKLLERLVCKQLVAYLLENDLFPDLQSAYRSNHSTETAVLKVLSDILLALDC